MIPVWLEVHVDGAALERRLLPGASGRAARWRATVAALDDLARRAERHGARLSFRVRELPAKLDDGLLRALVARGHEVGWHAHGNRLREARDAVVAAGGTASIATPGMVQAPDWRRMAAEARALGATVVTDRVEAPIVQYQGLLAWEPVPGLVSMDVTVSPFAWGVLRRDRRKVVPGHLDVDALLRLIEARARVPVPTGAVGFFGATFHDHDILEVGVRAALERVFARYGSRIVRSGDLVLGAGGPPPRRLPPDAPGGRARGPGAVRFARDLAVAGVGLASRASPWSDSAAAGPTDMGGALRHVKTTLHPRLLRLRLRLERHGAPAEERTLHVDGRRVLARRTGPAEPAAVLVLAHGGRSGVAQGLEPFGISEAALAEAGLAAWTFARSEGERPPGSPEAVAEARAVLATALAEGRPVVLLTWSAGVVPGLRAALELADPRVVALVDAEGPADRWSLVPPGAADHPLAARDPWDDAAWAGLEAARLVGAFPGRYLRLQAEDDHVHGRAAWHARSMVEAARDGRLNADGRLLPGRLGAHGDTILGWIRDLVVGPPGRDAP